MHYDQGGAAALARKLARDAEGVCRHYLSNGRREGRYWLVGDVGNSKGRSLFVRLEGPESGKGAAGKWTDAATGEHGDLLDLIRATRGFTNAHDVMDEARSYLRLPRAVPGPAEKGASAGASRTSAERRAAAGRLWGLSRPVGGSLADVYLRMRGLDHRLGASALRFHPACYHRDAGGMQSRPALIAAVTNAACDITGVHRTWLADDGRHKAPVETPRRAMGDVLGNGVRFGWSVADGPIVIAAGEGIETMLSLRMVMPGMAMVATLSAGHLGGFDIPDCIRRIYIAADGDGAGRHGLERLSARARASGIEALVLRPVLGDFNDDLRRLGIDELKANLRAQLMPDDAARLIGP